MIRGWFRSVPFRRRQARSFQNDQRVAAARKYQDVVEGRRMRRAGDPLGLLKSVGGGA